MRQVPRTFASRLSLSLAAMLVPVVAVALVALVAGHETWRRQTDVADRVTARVTALAEARNLLRTVEAGAYPALRGRLGARPSLRARVAELEGVLARLDGDETAILAARQAFEFARAELSTVLAGGGPRQLAVDPLLDFHTAMQATDMTLGRLQRAELQGVRAESASTGERRRVVLLLMLGLLAGAAIAAFLLARGMRRGLRHELDSLAERIDATHAALRHQAHHDALTGLPNRLLLADRVEQASARALRATVTPRLGLLLLDIDGFKTINNTLGHTAGNELLVGVAQRLTAETRPSDTVVRLGGDEFAVLLEDDRDDAAAEDRARRIVDALGAPFPVTGRALTVKVSAGFVVRAAGADAEQLMRDADVAMYRAQALGKARMETFAASMHHAVERRMRTEQELGHAIAAGELELHHQVIVDLATEAPLGVEALVRWRHPDRGMVPPMEFIPLAEESGLIVDLGAWVLEHAVTDILAINAGRSSPLSVSVNVSPRQLSEPGFAGLVAAQVARLGGRAELLVLELTEHAFLADGEAASATVRTLRDLGVRIAIDDFGTGWSSLSYLARLPIDVLKIDRSFVADLESGLVLGIIELARRLGVRTVAEGIERDEQRAALVAAACDAGQGYLFARPVPARELGAVPVA